MFSTKRLCLLVSLCIAVLMTTISCTPSPFEACADDQACSKGKICLEGYCRIGCRKQDDCTGGLFCFNGLCQDKLCTPGVRRPCFDGGPALMNVGLCRPGVQACEADGKAWGACRGQTLAIKETCDREDNDCNGQIDDGIDCSCSKPGSRRKCYAGPEKTVDVGTCAEGTQFCLQDNKWGRCVGAHSLPAPEVCDGADNDCNGKADDGIDCACQTGASRVCYTGPPGTLYRGLCVAGTQACLDGKWGPCDKQVLPQKEVCDLDGKDENCDGQINEDCPVVTKCTTDDDCSATTICKESVCVSPNCAAPKVQCGRVCVDTQTNLLHCGACDQPCQAGRVCSGGKCLDLMNDRDNCGTIGKACQSGESCCQGTCTNTDSSSYTCGGCQTRCAQGLICVKGACEFCGSTSDCPGQTYCSPTDGSCVGQSFLFDTTNNERYYQAMAWDQKQSLFLAGAFVTPPKLLSTQGTDLQAANKTSLTIPTGMDAFVVTSIAMKTVGNGSFGTNTPELWETNWHYSLLTSSNGYELAGRQVVYQGASVYAAAVALGEVTIPSDPKGTTLDKVKSSFPINNIMAIVKLDAATGTRQAYATATFSSTESRLLALAVHQGQPVITGRFKDTMLVGTKTLKAGTNEAHLYVARYKKDMSDVEWTLALPTSGDAGNPVKVGSLSCEENGNCWLAGDFKGKLEVDGKTLQTDANGDRAIFVLQISPTGKVLQASSIGTSGRVAYGNMALTEKGGLVMAGGFQKSLSLPGLPTLNPTPADKEKLFVARFETSPALKATWVKVARVFEGIQPPLVQWSPKGIFLSGLANKSIFFDGHTIEPNGVSSLYVMQLHNDGSFRWSKTVGTKGVFFSPDAMLIDGDGMPVLLGGVSGNNLSVSVADRELSPTGIFNDGFLWRVSNPYP